MIFIVFLVFLFPPVHIFSLMITASDFNQNYSEQNPLMLTENTVIKMDEDIIIKTIKPLFTIENSTQSIELVFSQEEIKLFQVIIKKDAVFNLKTFTKTSQKIIFKNTDLNAQNKSKIFLNGAHLVFIDGGAFVLSD